uniref:Tc1-like transposase DDE domain-containing protein n=1 Tax=Ditylenchus dipsaci TaxID=166011 RepID=A0A915EAM9_9BILA
MKNRLEILFSYVCLIKGKISTGYPVAFQCESTILPLECQGKFTGCQDLVDFQWQFEGNPLELNYLCLMLYLHRHSRQKLVYQQDNAGLHVSKNRRPSDPQFFLMMEWSQEQGIELLEWPNVSPDLNLMENIWGIMVRRTPKSGLHP